MEFKYFTIENFIGIQHVHLPLKAAPNSKVHALVGLNESGKTTILEAINYFTYKNENESLEPLDIPGYGISDVHSIIPIADQANFNGKISGHFEVTLDDYDRNKIADYLKESHKFTIENKIESLSVKRHIFLKTPNIFTGGMHGELILVGMRENQKN